MIKQVQFQGNLMTYITKQSNLQNIINYIPMAETAKVAIVRPTRHFSVVTADNPDMVKTIELQNAYVREKLNEIIEPLKGKELEQKKQIFIKEFQKMLSYQAHKEQLNLISKLKEEGIPIAELLEDKGKLANGEFNFYTDQIFATDTGQYYVSNGALKFLPSNFKNHQRRGEERLAIIQAKNFGAEVLPLFSISGKKLNFEGGDIRQMVGRKLFFVGQGHRSDPETSKLIAKITGYYVIPIILIQEQFYHLDCCFLPLPNDAAVIYEGEYILNEAGETICNEHGWPVIIPGTETMSDNSRALIRTIYSNDKLILISKAEALAFATNAAILQNTLDNRFKMFVNGENREDILDKQQAILDHTISYTDEHLEKIKEVTSDQMDIVEIPFQTMHSSGGSVRCTIQEVACTNDISIFSKHNHRFFDRKNADSIISEPCQLKRSNSM